MKLNLTALGRVCVALGLTAASSSNASDILAETDFGGVLQPIESARSEMISGVLPASVLEDSSWADVQVQYAPVADRLGSALTWVRAEVSKMERGQPQLKWPLGQFDSRSQLRIETTLGSPSGGRLTLKMMDEVDPYTVHWEQVLVPDPRRDSYAFEIELSALERSVALILTMDQTGIYDFYSMSVTRRGEDEIEVARQAAIAAAPVNLAPNSGFALGLPAAWSVGRNVSLSKQVSFEPATEKGSLGTVPLVIEVLRPGANYELYSAPFSVPDFNSIYVASFIASGEGSGFVRIHADGREVGSGPYQATAAGALVKVPFKISGQAEWVVLHWSGDESMRIDAVNVSLGRQALPFQLPGEVEVALAADFAQANVFIDEIDPLELKFAVTGTSEGVSLHARSYDLYGQSGELQVLPIDTATCSQTFVPELPDAERRFGSFRTELWAERDGVRISPVAEQVYHVVPRPIYWGKVAPESKFGNHFSKYDPHLYGAKAIGINWNRFHGGNAGNTTYWSSVEPQKGNWTWRDDNIQPYRDADFALCGVWTRVPNWARIERAQPEAQGWLDNWWQPRDLNEFVEYVKKSVQHHDGLIDAWQIWNEPWGEFWFKKWEPSLNGEERWQPGDTPVEDFATLSKAAWDAAQTSGVETTVLGVGATMGERGKKWMRDALAQDIENYADVISYHAYFGGKLQYGLDMDSALLRNLDRRVFDPIKEKKSAQGQTIWMTEGNWLERTIDSGLHAHSVPGSKDPLAVVRETAVKIPLYHAIHFARGAEKIFTYALNAGSPYYRPTPPGQINWASLVTPAGELHPVASVYAAMTQRMEPARDVGYRAIDESTVAFLFTEDSSDGGFIALFGEDLNAALMSLQAAGYTVDDFLGNPAKAGITHQLLYIDVASDEDAVACLELL